MNIWWGDSWDSFFAALIARFVAFLLRLAWNWFGRETVGLTVLYYMALLSLPSKHKLNHGISRRVFRGFVDVVQIWRDQWTSGWLVSHLHDLVRPRRGINLKKELDEQIVIMIPSHRETWTWREASKHNEPVSAAALPGARCNNDPVSVVP